MSLRSTGRQTDAKRTPFELMVVDNGSTDGTAERWRTISAIWPTGSQAARKRSKAHADLSRNRLRDTRTKGDEGTCASLPGAPVEPNGEPLREIEGRKSAADFSLPMQQNDDLARSKPTQPRQRFERRFPPVPAGNDDRNPQASPSKNGSGAAANRPASGDAPFAAPGRPPPAARRKLSARFSGSFHDITS